MADSLALTFGNPIDDYEAADPYAWKEEAVLEVIDRLGLAFASCFDNSVSSTIVNEIPIDRAAWRYIRTMISVRHVNRQTRMMIETGLYELERLLRTVYAYFLPRAKELMCVSYLKPYRMVAGKDVYVLRRLALTVLPANLEHLSDLAKELKNLLDLVA